MNQGSLKTYAQKARRDFIAAVSDRAAFYGLTASGSEPIVRQGDVVLIEERPFPREVAEKRGRLESRISVEGFEQTMEAMAYTWFNRFAAIRYMELHGYLDHGYRVLSHPEDRDQPEILDHATEVDLPDLDRENVVELKLDGARDEELYRLLLTAQCNALHQAMPFLFERIGDETELVLPVNLLHTDSLIRRLVEGIDEMRLGRDRNHRLAVPILHLGKERPGNRQAREIRGYSGGHPTLHAQLDREIHGAKFPGGAMARHVSALESLGTDGLLHQARRADRRGYGAACRHHTQYARSPRR